VLGRRGAQGRAANTMRAMRGAPSRALAPLCVLCGAAALLGCGSTTKTVTVSSAPPVTQPTTTATSTAKQPTSTAKTQTKSESATTGTTRSAPEPAFTQEKPTSESEAAAAALVRSKGFTPSDIAQYHTSQALRVLVATKTGSGDGYAQQAFFFVNGRYIGTDTREPSATLRVLSQSDTEVTLAYPLYRKSDPLCCPGGGQATVRFQLNNGRLTALDPIPPVERSNGLGRH
jgi:LppP/LprE lipoprotein